MNNARSLTAQATALLRANGFTWSGRPAKAINRDQSHFERKMVRCPFAGRSRPNK